MKYGIVFRNVADLRNGARFQSERKSQLLYGEAVSVGACRNDYLKIRMTDGYHGWLDKHYLHSISLKFKQNYAKRLNYQIISPIAKIYPIDADRSIPQFLFYGSRISLIDKDNRFGIIASLSRKRFKISLSYLEPIPNKEPINISGRDLVKEAKRFMGTPYLWGGVTPYGFDCSGLVQAVYRRFGIRLPRDSKDQKKAGIRIEKERIIPGDLLHFPGHVVIAAGSSGIIHASLREGGVQINSLKPGEPNFRKDLYDSFTEARRILK